MTVTTWLAEDEPGADVWVVRVDTSVVVSMDLLVGVIVTTDVVGAAELDVSELEVSEVALADEDAAAPVLRTTFWRLWWTSAASRPRALTEDSA